MFIKYGCYYCAVTTMGDDNDNPFDEDFGSNARVDNDFPGTTPPSGDTVVVGDNNNVASGEGNVVGDGAVGHNEKIGQAVTGRGATVAAGESEARNDGDHVEDSVYDSELELAYGLADAGELSREEADAVTDAVGVAEAYGIDEGVFDNVVGIAEERYGVGDAVEGLMEGLYEEFASEGTADTGALYESAVASFEDAGMEGDEVEQYMSLVKDVVKDSMRGPAQRAAQSLTERDVTQYLEE